jgi:hypothetical protein
MLPDGEACPAAMAASPSGTRACRADARLLQYVLDVPPQFGAPAAEEDPHGGPGSPVGRHKIAGTASSVT